MDIERTVAGIERLIFSGEPFTFFALHQGLDARYRLADRLIQKYRKKGFIDYERRGRDSIWSLTDAGKAEKARRDGGANG